MAKEKATLRVAPYVLKRGIAAGDTPTVRFTAKKANHTWPEGIRPDGERDVALPMIDNLADVESLAETMGSAKLFPLLQKLIAAHFAGGVAEKIKKNHGTDLPSYNLGHVLEILGRENKRDGSATRRKAYETELKKAKAIKTSIRDAAIAAVNNEYADVIASLNDETGENANG